LADYFFVVMPLLILYCFVARLKLEFAGILPLFPEYRLILSKKVKVAGMSALLWAAFAYHATVSW